MNVLIVDDSEDFRQTLATALREHVSELCIEEAGDANAAKAILGVFTPDLILMDIRLPGQSGLKLAEEIRKDLPGVPVFMMTAFDMLEYRKSAQKYGANGFIVKQTMSGRSIAAKH